MSESKEKAVFFDANFLVPEIKGSPQTPTKTIKDLLMRRRLQSSFQGGEIGLASTAATIYVDEGWGQYRSLLETEGQEIASYVPINVQQVTNAVRSVLAETFRPSSFDLSELTRTMFLLQEQVRDVGDSVVAGAQSVHDLKQQQSKQFTELQKQLGELLVAVNSARASDVEPRSEFRDAKEGEDELLIDLATFYRREVHIILGTIIAFLVGMTLLLFL
jgi:phage FluMu protein gp41